MNGVSYNVLSFVFLGVVVVENGSQVDNYVLKCSDLAYLVILILFSLAAIAFEIANVFLTLGELTLLFSIC